MSTRREARATRARALATGAALVVAAGCGASTPVDAIDARTTEAGGDAGSDMFAPEVSADADASGDAAADILVPATVWSHVLANVTVSALGPASADGVAVAGQAGADSSLGIKPGLFVASASASGFAPDVVTWVQPEATIEAVVGGSTPVVAVQGRYLVPLPGCIGNPAGVHHFYPPKSCGWGHSLVPVPVLGPSRLTAVYDATKDGLVAYFGTTYFRVDASTVVTGNAVRVAMDGTLTRTTDDRTDVVAVCRDDTTTRVAYVNAAGELHVRALDLAATDVLVARTAGTRADLQGRVGLACDAAGQVLAFRPAPGTSVEGKTSTAGDVVVVSLVAGKVGDPSWSHLPPPLGKEAVRVAGGPARAVFATELAGSGDLGGVPVSAGPTSTIGATVVAELTTKAKLRAVFPASIVGLRLVDGHAVVAGPLERPFTVDGRELKPTAPLGSTTAFVLGLRL